MMRFSKIELTALLICVFALGLDVASMWMKMAEGTGPMIDVLTWHGPLQVALVVVCAMSVQRARGRERAPGTTNA